jgi:hypothetical protein
MDMYKQKYLKYKEKYLSQKFTFKKQNNKYKTNKYMNHVNLHDVSQEIQRFH